MNEQAEAWAGTFGDEYTQRNQLIWRKRVPFWNVMLGGAYIDQNVRSVMEVGCNAGYNLTAIKTGFPHLGLHGIDVNVRALEQAKAAGLDCFYDNALDLGKNAPGVYDLVFTAGVLIHVPSEDLQATMKSIAQASRKFVLAVEYEGAGEEEIEYRGKQGMLWRRPYGDLYQQEGLKLVGTGEVGKDLGFDDCTWWLLEKS